MNPDSDLYVVITTIHPKTRGVRAYEAMPGVNVLLVGDRKTPPLEESTACTFLDVARQSGLGFSLASKLPYDHYARKNIGYLYAMRRGASVIYDTDDDNYPLEHWSVPGFRAETRLRGRHRFCNVYRHFTPKKVWPRGLPLHCVNRPDDLDTRAVPQPQIGVWQGLADGDPDVDAVYRLIDDEPVIFERRCGVWLPPHHYCPFNSQNTFWKREFFLLLYLPATTSFRFTDILRGYVAQRLLWEEGHCLGFMEATVFQERNVHDYMKDFAEEVDVYLQTEQLVDILEATPLEGDLGRKLRRLYEVLHAAGIVAADELELLDLWLADCTEAMGANA